MGIACCVKSVQAIIKMRTMVEEGIMEKDMAEQLIKKVYIHILFFLFITFFLNINNRTRDFDNF